MDFLLFTSFSILEGLALFTLLLTMFRYRFNEFLVPALILNVAMSSFSFLMRKEFGVENLVPILLLMVFVAFMFFVVKIPLLWAFITSIMAYVAFGLFQTGLIEVLQVLGVATFAGVRQLGVDAYIVQAIEFILLPALCYFLYRRGYGFSFDFTRFKFKHEVIVAWLVIAIVISLLGFILYTKSLLLAGLILLLIVAVLFYYAIKKEYGTND